MDPTVLATAAGTAAGVTLVLVELIKDGLIDPHVKDSAARTALLQSLNYAINFGLLALFLVVQHQWVLSNLPVYIGIALGQSVASHLAFKKVNNGTGATTAAPTTPTDMMGNPVPPTPAG